jgi:Cu-Zn family superoxide dismutase
MQEGFINRALAIAACSALAAACASSPARGPSATAELAPTQGNTARGTVTFTQAGDRVKVVANVSGLAPGPHGLHVHENGDCSAPDGMSAGGHFNPLGKSHGHYESRDRHAGDMPAIVADASGNATLAVTLDTITVGTGETNVVGRSVVVHKDADDYRTQPTGNAGARVACGVIKAA